MREASPATGIRWLLDTEHGSRERFLPRWIFLRALGLIYFSAFFPLVFQIRGLIGANGIFPAREYLDAASRAFGPSRFLLTPTLLWVRSGNRALMALCFVGMIASVLVVLNLWPRGTLLISFICYLSFIAAAGEFAAYQSDGMLLEAGFLAMFFAPRGWRPGWGEKSPPLRLAYFLLQWEWLRIYFESGIGKLLSHDPHWRNFSAMDDYYQNGPLPTWIGWYAQHLPHWFHAITVALTLGLEIGLIWMFLLPRRFRIILFFIVTPWEIGIILTANYTFLNYLVLSLGFLLLDDQFCAQFLPAISKQRFAERVAAAGVAQSSPNEAQGSARRPSFYEEFRPHLNAFKLAVIGVTLGWVF
ncbi:MAG TPA: lipase maturation factor family protein [Candidatus Acidoferrales bacterium]|nr:lipase maturation factor family protein [Candidatus Acidoferrales bacterium]